MSELKPKVFIASTTEAKNIALEIQESLEDVATVKVWNQGEFKPGSFTLETLIEIQTEYDFAIFILSMEDAGVIRNESIKISRDNVIFELGLFMSSLGRKRCFVVHPRLKEKFHLPTDLSGLTKLSYDPKKIDDSMLVHLGPVCTKIKRQINDIISNEIPISPSKRTPDLLFVKNLIDGAIETVCKAVIVPSNPNRAGLRVFIFRKQKRLLICSHFYSPNQVDELVDRLTFNIDAKLDQSSTVVQAAIKEKVVRNEINADRQQEFAEKKGVPENLKMVLAAPIFDNNNELWGVVDFDTSSDTGKKILSTKQAKHVIFRLSKHLQLIFSLE